MIYRGHVQNGMVVFDDQANLPEGTEVRVEPLTPQPGKTLAEQFADVVGQALDLPPDMAERHNHYLHGAQRKRGEGIRRSANTYETRG